MQLVYNKKKAPITYLSLPLSFSLHRHYSYTISSPLNSIQLNSTQLGVNVSPLPAISLRIKHGTIRRPAPRLDAFNNLPRNRGITNHHDGLKPLSLHKPLRLKCDIWASLTRVEDPRLRVHDTNSLQDKSPMRRVWVMHAPHDSDGAALFAHACNLWAGEQRE